jgi:hypothetical protein
MSPLPFRIVRCNHWWLSVQRRESFVGLEVKTDFRRNPHCKSHPNRADHTYDLTIGSDHPPWERELVIALKPWTVGLFDKQQTARPLVLNDQHGSKAEPSVLTGDDAAFYDAYMLQPRS